MRFIERYDHIPERCRPPSEPCDTRAGLTNAHDGERHASTGDGGGERDRAGDGAETGARRAGGGQAREDRPGGRRRGEGQARRVAEEARKLDAEALAVHADMATADAPG